MTAPIAVLGATGVFGRHLVPRLVAAGHRVRAIVRRPEAAGVARACGAELRVADLFEPGSLRAALEGCELAINLATSVPGPSGRGDYAANDRLRREGTPILLQACRAVGVRRLLQQSIAMVGAGGDALVDEEAPPAVISGRAIAEAAVAAALEMERCVRASELDWIILRGALFYGPGTGFDDDWFARAAAGTLRLPGEGEEFVSLVHVADMADAALAVVERWPSREVLCVADDLPVRWRDLFAYIAAAAGAAPPLPGGRAGFPSFRISNAKARARLGWAPRYRDYRVGLAR